MDILIDGAKYKVWREGQYCGIMTYREDEPNNGDCFLNQIEEEENGDPVYECCWLEEGKVTWELIGN